MKKILKVMLLFLSLFFIPAFVGAQQISDPSLKMEISKYYGTMPLMLSVHLELGLGESTDESLSSYTALLNDMKYYADLDVISYLKTVLSPSKSLDVFLSNLNSLLKFADSSMVFIDNKLSMYVQTKDNCDTAKSVSDKNFVLALKDFDSVNMEKNLQKSIESEECSTSSRIYYNAYSKILGQISSYYDVLNKKYDYFYNYKYELIDALKGF